MPRPITPQIHGILDYAVVGGFLLTPTLVSLSGLPAVIAYTLAGVHLTVTLITDFPLGLIKVLPLPGHGMIEAIVAPVLVALPWLLGFASDVSARYVYVAAGVALFVVWLLTDYKGAPSRPPQSA